MPQNGLDALPLRGGRRGLLSCVLVSVLALMACSQESHTLERAKIQEATASRAAIWGDAFPSFRAVWFVDEHHGWLVGAKATIWATRDAGASWQKQDAGGSYALKEVAFNDVVFVDPERGWIVGNYGTLLATKDGGRSWVRQDSGPNLALTAVAFSSASYGWVVGNSGIVLSTRDGGTSWIPRKTGRAEDLLAVASVGDGQAWMVGGEGVILRTDDYGSSWSLQHHEGKAESLRAIAAVDANTAWAVGDHGLVLGTTDGGQTWRRAVVPSGSMATAVQVVEGTVWISLANGYFLVGTNGGRSWELRPSGAQSCPSDLHLPSAGVGWAVGENGLILKKGRSGSSWERVREFPRRSLNAVSFVDPDHGWAVGTDGDILSTRDGGEHWEHQASGVPYTLWDVHFRDKNRGWVAGRGGIILSTENGGTTWTLDRAARLSGGIYALSFIDGARGWGVGELGEVIVTADGHTWKPLQSPTTENLSAVDFLDKQQGWVAGARGKIFATRDGGNSWRTQRSGVESELRAIDFVDSTHGWVVGAGGVVLRTLNGGEDWRVLTVPTHNSLFSVRFVDQKRGWVAGSGGVILMTRDGGETWTEQSTDVQSGFSGLSFVTDQNDSTSQYHGYAVAFDGSITSTDDEGQEWNSVQPWLLDVVFASRTAGWIFGSDGEILATTDGGRTWKRQYSGTQVDLINAAVANDNTVFVGGREGVLLVTSTGGEHWSRVPLWLKPDVEFEYALNDIFFLGQHGWIVTATGASFVTEDGGGHWKLGGLNPFELMSVYFLDDQRGWAAGSKRRLAHTLDGGRTWSPVETQAKGFRFQHIFFRDDHHGWVVGEGGSIFLTSNGGKDWEEVQASTGNDLYELRFVDALHGFAVGDHGTLLTTRDGGYSWSPVDVGHRHGYNALAATDSKGWNLWLVGDEGTIETVFQTDRSPSLEAFSSEQQLDGVRLEWTVEDEHAEEVASLGVEFRKWNDGPWQAISAKPRAEGKGRYSLSWQPSDKPYTVEPGAELFYRVLLKDSHQTVYVEVGSKNKFVYRSWWDRQVELVKALLGLSAALLTYLLVMVLLYGLAPGLIWRAASGVASKVLELLESLGSLVKFTRGLLQLSLVPWVATLPRVRRDWLRQYQRGRTSFKALAPELAVAYARHPEVRAAWMERFKAKQASLAELPGDVRSVLLQDVEVLDAWVERAAPGARTRFERLPPVRSRRIYVSLPLVAHEHAGERLVPEPGPLTFRPYFTSQQVTLCIIGQGGIGKSTLAFQLAGCALESAPDRRLCPHLMLPAIIDRDFQSLDEAVTLSLRSLLDSELGADLSPDVLSAFLSRKRILVIVDALSERQEQTQQALRTESAGRVSTLVITSRTPPDLARPDSVKLCPMGVEPKTLPLFLSQLLRSHDANILLEEERWMLLARKLSVLANRQTGASLTPLVIRLFVEQAIVLSQQGKTLETLPVSISECVAEYLKALNPLDSSSPHFVAEAVMLRCAKRLALMSLGERYQPGPFSRFEAKRALCEFLGEEEAQAAVERLLANGVLRQTERAGVALLIFELDPVAEYLAAMWLVSELRSDVVQWADELKKLQSVTDYPQSVKGFTDALADCHGVYQRDFDLPELKLHLA